MWPMGSLNGAVHTEKVRS